MTAFAQSISPSSQVFSGLSTLPSYLFQKIELLEVNLAKNLEDPVKAEALRKVYENHVTEIGKIWKEFESDDFTGWLVDFSKYLGCASLDHMDLALRTFSKTLLRSFQNSNHFSVRKAALDIFFKDLQTKWGAEQEMQPLLLPLTASKIVILYRKCGSGHLIAANAIMQALESKYTFKAIDGGSVEDAFKPNCRYPMRNGIRGSKSCMEELRKTVKNENPFLIISTVAHENKWTQLSYDLNIKMLVCHTDYEVDANLTTNDNSSLKPYKNERTHLVQYSIPHLHEDPNRAEIKRKIDFSRFKELFHELGFPIRPSFKREADPQKIASFRSELGILENERVVFMLSPYEREIPKITALLSRLMESPCPFDSPVYLLIVCGNSPAAKMAVQDKIKLIPPNLQIRSRIENALDEPTMAKYMAVTSRVAPLPGVMITKSGGSTTAEMAEMGVYSLFIETILGEKCNRDFLSMHNLGENLDEEKFLPQLNRTIQWKGTPESVYKPPLNWKVNFDRYIQKKFLP